MATRFPLSALSALIVAAPLIGAAPQRSAPDFSRFAPAHQARMISSAINDLDRVELRGNTPDAIRDAKEIGAVDPASPMDRMVLSLRLSPDAQDRLAQLTEAQQDPASPYYHQWLTPEQFGAMFGPSQADLDAVTAWLLSKGFRIDEIAAGRTAITFSGTAAQAQSAFRTVLRRFQIDGAERQANTSDPSIPAALAGVVSGVVSLHNIPRKASARPVRRLSDEEAQALLSKAQGISPQYSNGTNTVHYMAPGDFAAIYNAKALYTAATPITGSGVTLCIVGRAQVNANDPTVFRSDFGLSANYPTIFYNGTKPAINDNEATEALLDMEWSGATAPGAAIKFISTKSTLSTDGVDLSAQYIINNQSNASSPAYHVSVMSTSFGQCEANMGSTELNFYNNLWSQAATEGISSFVSTGDSGVAGCDGGSSTTGSGAAVSGLASTPYNTAVGGTEFNEGGAYATYWSATNTSLASALGYIPEMVWNESNGTTTPGGTAGSGLWSSSGGVSSTYAKPSWQVAPGVPADGHRDIPDVSLNAASYDGPLIVQTPNGGSQGIYIVGGTSASSPAFAGLAALVVQKTGANQGNMNPRLYQLAKAQYSGAGTLTAFHDVTSGNNSVPGVTGYSAGAGYDLATGLGSVDAAELANNWVDTAAPASVTGSETGTSGSITFSGSATDNIGVDHIDFLVDGTVKATASSSPFSATFDSTNLSNGSHTLVAKAYDAAGNNAASAGFPFSISNLPTGTLYESGSAGTITFSATASEPGGSIAKVTYYLDGAFFASRTSAPYTVSVDSTKLANGSHSLQAYATDSLGHNAFLSPLPLSFTVNNPVGTVSESESAWTITFSATASEPSGTISKVTYYLDGAFFASRTMPPYTVSVDRSKLANGSHSLQAYATDALGHNAFLSPLPLSFTVSNPAGSIFESGSVGTITFSATASEPGGTIAKVTYYLDGAFFASRTAAPYTVSVDSTKLANGSHSLQAYATDALGHNAFLSPQPLSFTLSN